MIRLFTAVGTYKLEESGIPVILAGGRECALDTHELLLWSSLAFRILTYQEAKAEFYAKERELHILSELDFDHYLNRLTMRRLIASGRDEVGVDALYDLLGHLYIEKTPSGLPAKTAAFLNLWLRKRMPFRKALAVFHTKKPEATEKKLLSLIRHQQLSTAELIQCMEKEFTDGTTWTHPEGGLFLWLTFPEGVSARKVFDKCIEKNVAGVLGEFFYPTTKSDRHMRINYSNMPDDRIKEGIRRMGEALREVAAGK